MKPIQLQIGDTYTALGKSFKITEIKTVDDFISEGECEVAMLMQDLGCLAYATAAYKNSKYRFQGYARGDSIEWSRPIPASLNERCSE